MPFPLEHKRWRVLKNLPFFHQISWNFRDMTTRLLIVLPVCHYQTTYCWKTKPKQLKWIDRRTPWPSNKKTGVDRRSNDEGQVMTIPHITLWFRWAKKDADIGKILLQIFRFAFYSTTQSCKKKTQKQHGTVTNGNERLVHCSPIMYTVKHALVTTSIKLQSNLL